MDDIKNETKKAEEQLKKAWSVQTIMGTLNEEQTMLMSYFIHTSLQKGRILGKMEMDGKTAKDIADALQVSEDQVKVILEEDPFEVVK